MLAEIPAEFDDDDVWVLRLKFSQDIKRLIRTSVIDVDQFIRFADPLQHGVEGFLQRLQILLFIKTGMTIER